MRMIEFSTRNLQALKAHLIYCVRCGTPLTDEAKARSCFASMPPCCDECAGEVAYVLDTLADDDDLPYFLRGYMALSDTGIWLIKAG